MSLLAQILFGHRELTSTATSNSEDSVAPLVNPATGLPMVKSTGIDIAGNPIGTNLSENIGNDVPNISSHCTFENSSADSIPSSVDDPLSDSFDSTWDNGFDDY